MKESSRSVCHQVSSAHLAKVKVDEVFCLVSHVRPEVAADDAVPRWVVLFVELLNYGAERIPKLKVTKLIFFFFFF